MRIARRLAISLGALAATTALATSCGGSHQTSKLQGLPYASQATAPTAAIRPHPSLTPHTTPLQRLSLAQLAGQRIVYAYGGLTPPPSLVGHIRRGEAAGVIFFTPNVTSVAQLHAVVGELQRANASSPVHAPLLMLTDQEGGMVRRLPGAPERSEKQIGASEDAVARAREAGTAAGENLAAAGLNVNLAPVLDVFRQPGNFIDQDERSYSEDPQLVAELGRSFVSGQQRTGVAATAKHFPGLGAAARSQNTDEGPVEIESSLGELRSVDELPYRAAIAARVHLVMMSWALYPALDPTLPAGLSPTVIEGELRKRLGFRGVTVSDSIGAGALNAFGGVARRAALAAIAGEDLILCSAREVGENNPGIGVEGLRGIASAITSGELTRASAERAASLVIALRLHA